METDDVKQLKEERRKQVEKYEQTIQTLQAKIDNEKQVKEEFERRCEVCINSCVYFKLKGTFKICHKRVKTAIQAFNIYFYLLCMNPFFESHVLKVFFLTLRMIFIQLPVNYMKF